MPSPMAMVLMFTYRSCKQKTIGSIPLRRARDPAAASISNEDAFICMPPILRCFACRVRACTAPSTRGRTGRDGRIASDRTTWPVSPSPGPGVAARARHLVTAPAGRRHRAFRRPRRARPWSWSQSGTGSFPFSAIKREELVTEYHSCRVPRPPGLIWAPDPSQLNS